MPVRRQGARSTVAPAAVSTEPIPTLVGDKDPAGRSNRCHGPWTLVETGALTGKRLTSYPSLQTDVRNAGGVWVDESAVVDDRGWTLITSRSPKDLADFTAAIDRVLAAVPA